MIDPIATQQRLARQAESIAALNDAFAEQADCEHDFVRAAELHVEGLIFRARSRFHSMLAELGTRQREARVQREQE